MATHKTFSLHLTTTAQSIGGPVPAGKRWTLAAMQLANVDGTNEADGTVQWLDASDSNKVTRLAYQVPVAAQDSLSPLVGSITFEAGDDPQAYASADGDIELTMSVIEGDA